MGEQDMGPLTEGRGPRGRGVGPGGLVLWSVVALLALPGLNPGGAVLSGQSIVGGEVEGRVLDEAARPIRGAGVTLREIRSGLEWTKRTGTTGVFGFESVPGGSFELRVEALGYRPLVVVGLGVTPGERAAVPVRLVAEPPPISQVDTVLFGGSAGGGSSLGRKIDARELSVIPDRIRDVAGLLALSSSSDPQGGLDGLPAGLTTLFADGEPFRPIQHPGLAGNGSPFGLLFPRVGLESVTVRTGLEDIEWSGSAGGVVSLQTRPTVSRGSAEVFGLWSGGPTWSNEVVGRGPELLSLWGGGAFSIPLGEGSPPFALSFEGGMVERPNLYWRDDYFAQRVAEGGPQPGNSLLSYGSALGRVEWPVGEAGRVTVQGGFSFFTDESDRVGVPRVDYGSELPGEGADGTLAAVVSFPVSERAHLEIRGAGALSSRTWGSPGDGPSGAFLVGDRALLGTDPAYPAMADRWNVSVTPVLHFRQDENRLKGGARLEYNAFDMSYVDQSDGAFFFGSRQALQGRQGAAITLPGVVPSESFAVIRTTLFGQYWWKPVTGLDLVAGASYRRENLPLQDVRPAQDWFDLTGVSNVQEDQQLGGFNARAHVRWDPAGDGRTWVAAGMSLERGVLDPAALLEVLTLDGAVTAARSVGSGLDWAEDEVPPSATVSGTRLALFSSDLQEPRTARGVAGISHAFSSGLRLGMEGSFRRTEFLLRRTDLNRLLVPSGTDQDGRPLFGDLRIVSGVLASDPTANRRFPAFESVWALSSDGWSDYLGVTASVDASIGEDGFLSLRYTWSRTTDNWVGASQAGTLARLVPELPVENWDEARSDFDIPHRFSALVAVPLPLPGEPTLTAMYTLRSDLPFTPKVAAGLDANGDGSPFNDVAFVPSSGEAIEALAREWDCLAQSMGTFAERNGCRGDPVHTLDMRFSLGLPRIGPVASTLVVDGLNLTDADMGIRDDNLLLLRGGSLTRTSGGVRVPYRVNPGFGGWIFRGDTGRMVRVGIRIGGGG